MSHLINFTDPVALLQKLIQFQEIPGTHKDFVVFAVDAEGPAAFYTSMVQGK